MKTPFSVITNAAYLVVGAYIALHYGTPFSLMIGFFIAVMGVLSAWYHATYQVDDQMGDRKGMYLAFASMLGASVYAVVGSWHWPILAATAVVAVTLAALTRPGRLGSMWTLPPLILPQLALVGYATDWWTAGLLLVGYLAIELFRELPETNFWATRPTFEREYDWIHGTWHIGTAVIIYINAIIILEAM